MILLASSGNNCLIQGWLPIRVSLSAGLSQSLMCCLRIESDVPVCSLALPLLILKVFGNVSTNSVMFCPSLSSRTVTLPTLGHKG